MVCQLRKLSFDGTLPNYIIQYTLGTIHCKEKNFKNIVKCQCPQLEKRERRGSDAFTYGEKFKSDVLQYVGKRKKDGE